MSFYLILNKILSPENKESWEMGGELYQKRESWNQFYDLETLLCSLQYQVSNACTAPIALNKFTFDFTKFIASESIVSV